MKPYYNHNGIVIYHGDCLSVLRELPPESIQCCVTSPPYWGLRDYGVDGQLGLEKTPEEYVEKMVDIFREVKRVLKKDGTLWLNLGDSYNGSGKGPAGESSKVGNVVKNAQHLDHKTHVLSLKPKDLIGIPWRVAFALQADGWYLRSDIIWHKLNPMPESVTDRPTKSHEYIFLMSKSAKYFYDADAIRSPHKPESIERARSVYNSPGDGSKFTEQTIRYSAKNFNHLLGRNKRSVWTIPTKPYKEAHFAVFPPNLIRPCILAGSKAGDTILDPFGGAMTTAYVAKKLNRKAIMIELNESYIEMGVKRLAQEVLPLEA